MNRFALSLFSILFLVRAAFGAEGERPPNILFAIADDWGLHAGAYGTEWISTPVFDRVARQGILFQRAYTPNPKCAPSRACLLTGRNPWQLKAAANHVPFFPPEFKTWPEALHENGWFVGCTGKGWGPGVATNAAGQRRAMTGQPFNSRKTAPPASGMSANDYAANFEAFLDAAPKGKPWMFWYGALEPHRGYEFRSGASQGGKELDDIKRVPAYWPDNETIRHDMLDYAFEAEHFDRHLGRMLDELEARGLLENTVVVVTSDHGMPSPRVKGQLYEAAAHVPLAIMWPEGIRAPGTAAPQFVSFIDLAPTLIELAGLRWRETGMAPAQGRGFAPLLRSNHPAEVQAGRDHVLLGRERQDVGRPGDAGYPVRGITTANYLYLHNFEPDRWPSGNPETGYLDCDGSPTKTFILEAHRKNPSGPFWALCFGKRPAEELYDLRTDPDCVENLAAQPEHKAARERLKYRLFAELKAQGDPRMHGQGGSFDAYPYAHERHRNFYERFMRGEDVRAGWANPGDFEPSRR